MAAKQNKTDIGTYRSIRLRQNKQGYWEVWWTDATDALYLTKRCSCRTADRTEAEAYLDAFCADARAQAAALTSAQTPTIEQLCQRWLAAAEKEGKATTGRNVLAHVRRILGRLPADQLDIADYAQNRMAASGTVRRELGALRTVLIWAADRKQISRDDIPVFKGVIPASGPPRQRFLDQIQEPWFWAEAQRYGERTRWPAQAHLEADAAYRVSLFTAIGLDTAARRSAIMELTWDRVDLGMGMIDFQTPGQRLTKKRRVRVPIAKRLMPVLKEAWLRAPKDAAGRAQGRVVGTAHIAKAFARFASSIGVPWVTPHVMRHTWGSLRAMEGSPLYDIAQGMGDTMATVEANYLHLTPDHLKRVFKA